MAEITKIAIHRENIDLKKDGKVVFTQVRRKIENKRVYYSATITLDKETDKYIKGSFPSYHLTGQTELDMIDNAICFHIQYPKAFEIFMKDMKFQNFSKLKRKAKDKDLTFVYNKEYREWLVAVLVKMVKEYHKLPSDVKPLKYFTKTSEFGIFQPMDCYFYFTGMNKAQVHYMTQDFGFKTTKAPKELTKLDKMKEFKKDLKDEIAKMMKGIKQITPKLKAPKIPKKKITKGKAKTTPKAKPIAKNTATKTESKTAKKQPEGKKEAVTISEIKQPEHHGSEVTIIVPKK